MIVLIDPFGRLYVPSGLRSGVRSVCWSGCFGVRAPQDARRIRSFIGHFQRNGKSLRSRLLLCKLLLLIRINFACSNPLLLLLFVLRVLEPSFELKTIKRRKNKRFIVVIVNSKRRASLASKFVFESALEQFNRIDKKRGFFLNVICEQLRLVVGLDKTCGPLLRYRRHNFFVRRARFDIMYRLKYASKIFK